MSIGLPTASRACVRKRRRTRAAVDNPPQPAETAPIGPLKTVLTSGATSNAACVLAFARPRPLVSL
jgi:hypothetical protein